MYALPLADGSADSVIIHQVLHYAHSPAAAIAEAARVLAPGGTLLVVDFAAARARGAARQRRPYPARLRRRGDGRLVRGRRASTIDHVEHLEGGELTVTLWRGVKAGARSASGGRHEPPSRASPRTSRCSPRRAATSRSASNSSRPRPRRWKRRCGSRSRRSRRSQPRFVSVTYGAGGSTRERTHATVERIVTRNRADRRRRI